MAKLPNIIEKDRSLWTTTLFVFRESFKGSKKYATLRLISNILGAVFSFIEFGALAMIVNEFATKGVGGADPKVLALGLGMLIASDFIPEMISSVQSYYENTFGDDISRHIQHIGFSRMRDLDIGTIEQPEFQNILETFNTRGWGAFYSTSSYMLSSLKNFIAVIIASISLIVISPWVLLIIFIGTLPTFFFNKKNAELSGQIWDASREKGRGWRARSEPVYEKLSLIELKNFSLVRIFWKKWHNLIGSFHGDVQVLRRKKIKFDFAGSIILAIAFGLSFAILIHQVTVGTIAIGSLVFSVSVVSRFQSGINQIFSNLSKMIEHKKGMNAFMDLVEMEPLIQSGTLEINPEDFKTLEIRNVSFAYPGASRSVIHNMSLKINHTDSLAIVGLNGAGKTTLIKLLTRVYDPTKGKILVNGVDLREYDLKSWKRCLGILLQDYSIYSEETIAENIMLGDTSKHDQGFVEAVAKETTADEYIQELPEKYQQRVGTEFQGGVELSKGQKQKLALARVLYRNAPIVILDEPTAAIDALSEDFIFKALRNNHKHQTRIIISHKFSNVRDADKIILIEHGKIIEQGSHDELMAIETGKYRELFNLQAEGYQDKPKRKPRAKKPKLEETQEVAQ